MGSKTRKEINDLKHDWNGDSCWDIEDTEGFEEYKDELLIHRLTMEKKWNKSYNEELEKYSRKIGTGSQKLANHIRFMEGVVERLERRVDELENNQP